MLVELCEYGFDRKLVSSVSSYLNVLYTAQKMKFSVKGFLWIWSHLLKKSLMENFIFCAVVGAKERSLVYILPILWILSLVLFNLKQIVKYRNSEKLIFKFQFKFNIKKQYQI